MNEQRLAFLFRSPQIVEAAVRAALADALAVRRMRLGDIDARSFGNRALELLGAEIQKRGRHTDALGLHQLEVETVRAAARFFSSKLGRRLLTIESDRLEAPRSDFDASVRDAHGRLHVVRIEATSNNEERVQLGRHLAERTSSLQALHAPRIHLFSLRDARLRSFTFPAASSRKIA
jgi:hypothetical protein